MISLSMVFACAYCITTANSFFCEMHERRLFSCEPKKSLLGLQVDVNRLGNGNKIPRLNSGRKPDGLLQENVIFQTGQINYMPKELSNNKSCNNALKYCIILKALYARYYSMTVEQCLDLFGDQVVGIEGYGHLYLKVRDTCLVLSFTQQSLVWRLTAIHFSPCSRFPLWARKQYYKKLNGAWMRISLAYWSTQGFARLCFDEPSNVDFEDDVIILHPNRGWSFSMLYEMGRYYGVNSISLVLPEMAESKEFNRKSVISKNYYLFFMTKDICFVWSQPKDHLRNWKIELWFRAFQRVIPNVPSA